jgi:hypothetical protein
MFSLFRKKSAPALALRQPLPQEDDAEVVMVELRGESIIQKALFSVTSAPQKALVGQTAKFVVSAPPDVAYRYRLHIEHRAGMELGANETATEQCTPWQDFPEIFYCFASSGVYSLHLQVALQESDTVLESIYLNQSFVLPHDIMTLLVSNTSNFRLSFIDIPTRVYIDNSYKMSWQRKCKTVADFYQRVLQQFTKFASIHSTASPHADVQFALHAMNVVASLWIHPDGSGESQAALQLEDHLLDDDAKLRVMLAARHACCMDTAMLMHMLLTRHGIRNQIVQVPGHVLNQIITPEGGTWLLDGYTNIAANSGIVGVVNGDKRITRFRYPHCNLTPNHPNYCIFISRFRDYMHVVYGNRMMQSFAINYGDNLPRDYKAMANNAKEKLKKHVEHAVAMMLPLVFYPVACNLNIFNGL